MQTIITNTELSVIVKQSIDQLVKSEETFSAMTLTEKLREKMPSIDLRYSRIKPIVHDYMKEVDDYEKSTEFHAINKTKPVNKPQTAVMGAIDNKPISPMPKINTPIAYYSGKIDKNGGLHIRSDIVKAANYYNFSFGYPTKLSWGIAVEFGTNKWDNSAKIRQDGRLSIPCGKQNAGRTVQVKAYAKKIVIEGV